MSAAQLAGKAVNAAGKAASKQTGERALGKGAKRDPELYVLASVMAGAFGLVGYYFGNKPTSSTSEAKVTVAHGSMPWNAEDSKEGDNFKYKYHPGGDHTNAPKEAPSALHTVIVPNVNLPKLALVGAGRRSDGHLHERFNKWGKDGY